MLGGVSIFRKGKTVKSSQKDIIYSILMPTKKNHLQWLRIYMKECLIEEKKHYKLNWYNPVRLPGLA